MCPGRSRQVDHPSDCNLRFESISGIMHAAKANYSIANVRAIEQKIALSPDQQHGDEDLPPCCCVPGYGSTLVKPPPTPRPVLLDTPPLMAAPLPMEAAPLTALL